MRPSTIAEPPVTDPTDHDTAAEVQLATTPPAAETGIEQVIDVTQLPTTPTAHIEAPTWHSGRWVKAGPDADIIAPPAQSAAAAAPSFALPDELPAEPAPEPASAEQRMKLARAFLDIGDEHSAKQLLREIKQDASDPLLRTEASKLLRDIG